MYLYILNIELCFPIRQIWLFFIFHFISFLFQPAQPVDMDSMRHQFVEPSITESRYATLPAAPPAPPKQVQTIKQEDPHLSPQQCSSATNGSSSLQRQQTPPQYKPSPLPPQHKPSPPQHNPSLSTLQPDLKQSSNPKPFPRSTSATHMTGKTAADTGQIEATKEFKPIQACRAQLSPSCDGDHIVAGNLGEQMKPGQHRSRPNTPNR